MVPPVASERVNRTPPRQADAAIPLDPPPRFASSVPSSSVEHIPLRSVDHDTGSAHQSKERLPLAHQFPPATASGKAPTAEALKLAPSDAPRGWGEAFRFPMQRQPTQEKGLEPIAYDLPVKGEVPSEKATTQVSVSLSIFTIYCLSYHILVLPSTPSLATPNIRRTFICRCLYQSTTYSYGAQRTSVLVEGGPTTCSAASV